MESARRHAGHDLHAGDVHGLLSLPFPLLHKGDGRKVENVLRGTFETVSMTVFDYSFYVESTDANGHTSRSTYPFTCVLASIDAAGARLRIAPENVFTRLADAVALDDLQFESEEFNRAFNVTGEDARFATSLLDARMMGWLLASANGCSFEVVGDALMVWVHQVDVEDLPVVMRTAAAFVAHIPRVVSSLYPKSG